MQYIPFLTWGYILLILQREEGEEKKHQCDRETSNSCLPYAPQPKMKPTAQVCTLTRGQILNPQDDAPAN